MGLTSLLPSGMQVGSKAGGGINNTSLAVRTR